MEFVILVVLMLYVTIVAVVIADSSRSRLSIESRAECEEELQEICEDLLNVCKRYDKDMSMFNVRIYEMEDPEEEGLVMYTFHNEYWRKDQEKPICRIVFSNGMTYNEKGEHNGEKI